MNWGGGGGVFEKLKVSKNCKVNEIVVRIDS